MNKRVTEEQVIGFLHEAEAGLPVEELCRGQAEPPVDADHHHADDQKQRRAAVETRQHRLARGHFDRMMSLVARAMRSPVRRPSRDPGIRGVQASRRAAGLAWIFGSEVLSVAQQVRRHERVWREAPEGTGDRKQPAKKLLVESMLENEVTREAPRKKW